MQDRKQWGPREPLGLLRETTVLVVGLGRDRAAHGASCCRGSAAASIGVHRREVDVPGVTSIVPVEAFADAAREADAIVLALPGTAQTEGMLSREVLAAVKPGITIVNVGRGSTVDEPALIEALQDGRVGLAVLDVVAVEPLPQDSPLWTLPERADRPAHRRDQPARAAPDRRALRRQRAPLPRRPAPAEPRQHRRVLLTVFGEDDRRVADVGPRTKRRPPERVG